MAALAVLLSGCAGNPDSYHQQNEKVTVNIIKLQLPPAGAKTAVAPLALGVLAPIAIDAAIKFGKARLEKEAARYAANHSGAASTDAFYANGNINITHIEYKRTAGGTPKDAFQFKLKPVDLGNGRFFRLQLQELQVAQAKAKLRRGDKTVDLLIEVKLQGFWVDKDNVIHAETLGQTAFPMYGVELGKKYLTSESDPLPTSDWLPAVPLSATAPRGDGVASFTITVSEVDDYGKKIRKAAGFIEDNTPSRDDLKKLFGGG